MILIMLWFKSHVCFVKYPGDIYEASSLSDFFKYKKKIGKGAFPQSHL